MEHMSTNTRSNEIKLLRPAVRKQEERGGARRLTAAADWREAALGWEAVDDAERLAGALPGHGPQRGAALGPGRRERLPRRRRHAVARAGGQPAQLPRARLRLGGAARQHHQEERRRHHQKQPSRCHLTSRGARNPKPLLRAACVALLQAWNWLVDDCGGVCVCGWVGV